MNDIEKLAQALKESIKRKNTLTVNEFKRFHPLYKKETDTTTEEYDELCKEFKFKVSLFDPIVIVDNVTKEEVVTLPPVFVSVDDITKSEGKSHIVDKFDNAMKSNHPLRTDAEEALYLFKAHIFAAQDVQRINASINQFKELADNAGFGSNNEETSENREESTKKILEKLEWK